MHLVKVAPFSVLVGNGDTTPAGYARKDAGTVFGCAAETIRYHIYFVKEG